jgi:large subunit ribosomal protein L25
MKRATIEAKSRQTKGSQKARQMRDIGNIPAVVYGGADKGAPNRTVKYLELEGEAFGEVLRVHAQLVDLNVDGQKEAVAVLKEIQRDAFGDKIMHVDFERVDITKPLHLNVPLTIKGTPKGLSKGGQLRVELYDLAIEALINAIPEEIVVKVDDLDLNDVLRVKDLKLPEGVKTKVDPDHVVAAVRPPVVEAEPTEAVAGTEPTSAEPEVIGLKAKLEEGAEGEAAAPADKAEKKEKK